MTSKSVSSMDIIQSVYARESTLVLKIESQYNLTEFIGTQFEVEGFNKRPLSTDFGH